MGRPDIGGGTSGPASRVPAHRARNDPPGGVASRTSLLPSCADTPRIRRDEGHKPTGRGGLGQGGRQPIRPGNRGVLPLATVIASVNCPRCLAEQVTKHPPARNHPTCDCCHDPLHRAAPAAVALPTGGLVVRADSRTCARAEMSASRARISMHRMTCSLTVQPTRPVFPRRLPRTRPIWKKGARRPVCGYTITTVRRLWSQLCRPGLGPEGPARNGCRVPHGHLPRDTPL